MSTTNSKLTRVADNIRILSAAMVEKAKSGHPGGAMGGADFITVLFTEFLRYDPDNMAYPYRDRFFLDPGHMSTSGCPGVTLPHWRSDCRSSVE